jgi:aminopeptidase YwaD
VRFQIPLTTFLILFSLPVLLRGDGSGWVMEDFILIENLKRHVLHLHFDRSPHDHDLDLEQAARYIEAEMQQAGLDVTEDAFEWEGRSYRNIVAERRGNAFPGRVVIVGAHYDTVPGSPGADDNGSAISVLLEVARCLRKSSPKSTIRLVAFTLEEPGFLGSIHYAEKVKKKGEQVLGMFSLEMVGFTHVNQKYPPYVNPKYYPNVGDFVAIIGNERSQPLLEEVVASFKNRVPELPVESLLVPKNGEETEEARLSDNSSFWDRGFPAVMITDTAFLRNPNYHLPSDTIETLDFGFMKKVATGVTFSVIELAK